MENAINAQAQVNVANELTIANELAMELDKIRSAKKELARREKEITEKFYKAGILHEGFESEEITTDKVVIRKIPALSGKRYDVEKARILADSLGMSRKELVNREWKFTVNEDKLDELVNEGKISEEVKDSLAIKANRIKVDVK